MLYHQTAPCDNKQCKDADRPYQCTARGGECVCDDGYVLEEETCIGMSILLVTVYWLPGTSLSGFVLLPV